MRKHLYRALVLLPNQSLRDKAFGFAVQTAEVQMARKLLPVVSPQCLSRSASTAGHMYVLLHSTIPAATRSLHTLWRSHCPHTAAAYVSQNNTSFQRMQEVLDICVAHSADQSFVLEYPFVDQKSPPPLAYYGTTNTKFNNSVAAQVAAQPEGLSVVGLYVVQNLILHPTTMWQLLGLMAHNLPTRKPLDFLAAVSQNLRRKKRLPPSDVELIWNTFQSKVDWEDCPTDVLALLVERVPSAWLEQLLCACPTLVHNQKFIFNVQKRMETSMEVFECIEKMGGVFTPPHAHVIKINSKEFRRDYAAYTAHTPNVAQRARISAEVAEGVVEHKRKM